MIVVTGGAGFIGSNLVHALNAGGRTDILVVDDLRDGHKFTNLAGATIADYRDRDEFRALVADRAAALDGVELVYHLGACSDTTQWDGRFMMETNYAYSRDLLAYCQAQAVPFVYASSAAVYGTGHRFAEEPDNEQPLNIYGWSKLVFDQHVRRLLPTSRARVVGLRYFNVYGPRERHKGRMASVVQHFDQQLRGGERIKLFGASHGVAAGEQRRDFVHVDDAVAVTLWAGTQARASGIYNCGTGSASSFNAVARAVVAWHGRGDIEYIPFPSDLEQAYQSHTEADLERLRGMGCAVPFRSIADGVPAYLEWLNG